LYYQAFPNDRLSTKSLVYFVYAIELVDTILMTHAAFTTFEYGFGDFAALTNTDFNWLSVPIMGAILSFIGQPFYAYRVHLISKSWLVIELIL
ncbi:hypothetical protein B0H17DRAFT_906318, partial [Mycena rosella]